LDEDDRGLSQAQKAYVNDLCAAGYTTPKPLLQEWIRRTRNRAEDIPPVPKKTKLVAFVRYQKQKRDAGSAIGVGVTPLRLKTFALEHTKGAEQARLGDAFDEHTPY
jgi:hypothetical protein